MSPLATIGGAGAPICCATGTFTTSGTGNTCIELPADNLLPAGCMPPIENVFNTLINFMFLNSVVYSLCLSRCGFRCLYFARWKVQLVYCMRWANSYAFATHLTFVKVDVCNVVFNCYCIKGTLFGTFATSNASSSTSLTSNTSFVLVYTRDPNATVLWTLVAQLNDVFRTSFYTSATSHTLLIINKWQASCLIHVNSIELTRSNTIATT